MKFFKQLSVALTAAMLLSSFGALAVSAEEETEAEVMEYDDSVTLTFSYWGAAPEKAAVENVLNEFTEATGIEVDPMYIPDDYITKISTLAASGDLPDCGYLTEQNVLEWYLNGMITDMTDTLDQLDIMDACKYKTPDGTTVAASIANETIILYYNKKAFDEAGVDYPPATTEDAWTWDEFIDVCTQMTVDKNGLHPDEDGFDPDNVSQYGCRIEKKDCLLEPLMRSNGGGIYTDDGLEVALDSPESIEVLDALADMINVQYVSPSEDSSVATMDMSASFLSNSLAMQLDGQWCVQSMIEATEEDGVEWGVGVLPYFTQPSTDNTGTPVVMFEGSEHPTEQAMLAQYFLDPEYVISLINSGLWMPTSEKWYTDEEYIDQWVTDEFPDDYRTAVIDYTLDCLQPNSWYTVAFTNEAEDIWLPVLDTVWNGSTDAQTAIDSVIDAVRDVHQKYLDMLE